MLNQVIAELGTLAKNKDIDKRVDELRKERKQNEVNKAAAEKILDEVDRFKREKNTRLSNEINNHFKLVSFKLFDYLKNGNYQECVELMIDNKPITNCANGSLIQLAKLDCIAGLQDYFEQFMPVFLDDAALITSNTSERIDMNTQLIQLVASDGVNELKVEKEK